MLDGTGGALDGARLGRGAVEALVRHGRRLISRWAEKHLRDVGRFLQAGAHSSTKGTAPVQRIRTEVAVVGARHAGILLAGPAARGIPFVVMEHRSHVPGFAVPAKERESGCRSRPGRPRLASGPRSARQSIAQQRKGPATR